MANMLDTYLRGSHALDGILICHILLVNILTYYCYIKTTTKAFTNHSVRHNHISVHE